MAKIVSSPKMENTAVQTLEITKFKGIDVSSGVSATKPYRSIDSINIKPDLNGFPVKRPGYWLLRNLGAHIYGAYEYRTGSTTKWLVHAGNKLYFETTVMYTGMALHKSEGFLLEGKLWIIDGTNFLVYDGTSVVTVESIATVPIITIGRNPAGTSATSYKATNLLSSGFTDSFLGTASTKDYQLSYATLAATAVTARTLNNNGTWTTLVENTGFTVNRTTGVVTFTIAPGASPITGQDNVQITAYKTTNGAAKIKACTIGIIYGVNGALDRLFLGGSPTERAYDYHSEFKDPTYFGDQWYAIIGQVGVDITAYTTLNDKLVTFKDGESDERNIFIRSAVLDTAGNATFPLYNVIQGHGCLGAVGVLGSEPLFLTRQGVYALTPSDITGERYSQLRSYYINGQLLQEANLQNALPITFDRFFGLSINGKMYILDSHQKEYEPNSPHSTYQYEGYIWTNIEATAVRVRGDVVAFGTTTGNLFVFYEDYVAGGYNDNGAAITARWTTPLLELGSWTRFKTIKDVWITAQPYTRSSGAVFYATDQEYKTAAKTYNIDVFNFDDVDFDRFTFNTLYRPNIIPTRKKSKKAKLFSVIVENAVLNEPFGIMTITIEFREAGKIKKQ